LGLRIFKSPTVGLPGFSKQLSGRKRVRGLGEKLRGKEEMPEAREEDMREAIPIPTKPLVPAIPTNGEDLRELGRISGEWVAMVCSSNPGMSKRTAC
jgi:hypothetical protein